MDNLNKLDPKTTPPDASCWVFVSLFKNEVKRISKFQAVSEMSM
jgi:hypothetical protein